MMSPHRHPDLAALRAALTELLAAIRERRDFTDSLRRIDELRETLRPDADTRLLHYLDARSFEKALAHLTASGA